MHNGAYIPGPDFGLVPDYILVFHLRSSEACGTNKQHLCLHHGPSANDQIDYVLTAVSWIMWKKITRVL
jgi:hypothetical protein